MEKRENTTGHKTGHVDNTEKRSSFLNSFRVPSHQLKFLRVGVRGGSFCKSSLPRFVFLLQQAFGNVNDMLDGEPEVLEQHVAGGGLAKAGHADHRAVEPHVLPPTVHGGSFDRHARTHGAGQHVFLVFGRLRVKKTRRKGMETTRALRPFPASASAAETASCTSEPVAMRITSGVPSQSLRIYAPRFTASSCSSVRVCGVRP